MEYLKCAYENYQEIVGYDWYLHNKPIYRKIKEYNISPDGKWCIVVLENADPKDSNHFTFIYNLYYLPFLDVVSNSSSSSKIKSNGVIRTLPLPDWRLERCITICSNNFENYARKKFVRWNEMNEVKEMNKMNEVNEINHKTNKINLTSTMEITRANGTKYYEFPFAAREARNVCAAALIIIFGTFVGPLSIIQNYVYMIPVNGDINSVPFADDNVCSCYDQSNSDFDSNSDSDQK